MSRPPYLVDVRFARPGGSPRRLWLPVFIVWPLLAILGLLAVGIAGIADALFYAAGQRVPRWTALLLGVFEALDETRGLQVNVNGGSTNIDLVVK